MSNSFTISISPEKFEAAKTALCEKAQGCFPYSEQVNGTVTSGSVEDEGVSAEFSYDTSTQVLTVNILKKPFIVSESFVEGKIKAWFAV